MHGTRYHKLLAFGLIVLAACGPRTDDTDAQPAADPALAASDNAHDRFWAGLLQHCGQAYEGAVVEAPADDTTFAGRRLVMHVRECSDSEIRIPFHVGENRSRTWVLTRTEQGIRLKHDHRHEDGTDDEITMYGGDTAAAGTAEVQEFPADQHTATLIPAASTNVWTVEIRPGQEYVYALRREGTDRRFRIEFDLTREVEAPPTPWGF
ncbi:hypothetical protein BH23GEM9_BH23GEM9_16920 [soil metagenome]